MKQFLRRHAVRIVTCLVLLLATYGGMHVFARYLEHRREVEIAQRIQTQTGKASFKFIGPQWIPNVIQEKLLFWHRIRQVEFGCRLSELWSRSEPESKAIDVTVLKDLARIIHEAPMK